MLSPEKLSVPLFVIPSVIEASEIFVVPSFEMPVLFPVRSEFEKFRVFPELTTIALLKPCILIFSIFVPTPVIKPSIKFPVAE